MDDDFWGLILILVIVGAILLLSFAYGVNAGMEQVCLEAIPNITSFVETQWLDNACYGVNESGALELLYK